MGLQVEPTDPHAFLRHKRLVLSDGVVVLERNSPRIQASVAVTATFLLPMLGQ